MCALILNKTFLNQLPGRCNHRRRLKLQSSLHAQRHYIGFAGSEQAVESAAWKTLFENNVPEGSSDF